jgi:membrane protease YdiL (CAAX protease family)
MRALRTRTGRVRPSVKLGGFVALVAVAFGLTGVLVGLAGPVLPPGALSWLFPVALVALLLAATWAALRLEGGRLADLGLRLTRRRLAEGGAGFAVGAAVFSGIALAQAAMVGAPWQFNGARVAGAATAGLAMMLVSVVGEELMFRGYAFRQLTALGGPTLALMVTSVAFGCYHLVGRPYWAMGAFFVVATAALGGLVFGYASIRSGGLVLPIGVHWGGNWAMVGLFGFQTAPGSGPSAVWTTEVTPARFAALTAPDLLPHLPYLTAMGLVGLLLWRWSVPRSPRAV